MPSHDDDESWPRIIAGLNPFSRSSRRTTIVAFALFAVFLMVTAMPASAAHVAILSEHSDDTELGTGTLTDTEVERSGEPAVVGHDTARSDAVARWAMDHGSGSTAYDHVGSNDGTINGATWVSGQSGQALDFDGTDDNVNSGDIGSQSSYTISFWSKHDSPGDGDVDTDLALLQNNGILLRDEGDSSLYFYHRDGSDTYQTISASIPDTGWHHWTATWDGSTIRLYRDGELVASGSATGSTAIGRTDRIGARQTGGGPSDHLDGTLDDVRIYSAALTPGQIKRLNDAPSAKQSSAATERWAGDAGLGETVFGDEGDDGTFQGSGEETSAWAFNEGLGDTVYDLAGSNDGALNGDPQWVSGQSGQALDFDGSNDHVSTSASVAGESEWGASVWINLDSKGSNQEILSEWGSSSTDQAFGLRYSSSADEIQFFIRQSDGSTNTVTAAAPATNEWHHIAVRASSSNGHMILYVDGEIPSSAATAGWDGTTDGSSSIIIGRQRELSNYFDGQIDDVKTYSSAVTPGEAARFTNEPEVRHNPDATHRWGLDAGTGSAAYDDEGSDGTINGATWTTGVSGPNALQFDNTDDDVDTPIQSLNAPVTVTAWIKPNKTDSSLDNDAIFANHNSESGGDLSFDANNNVDGGLALFSDETGTAETGTILTADTWEHVAFTINGSGIFLYHNGSLVASNASGTTGAISNTANYTIGNRGPSDSDPFDGNIDDVRVYENELTESEIEQIYNDPTGQVHTEHYGDEWVTGQSGDAMDFEGNSEYVTVSNSSTNTLTGNHTISMWLRFNRTPGDNQLFYYDWDANSGIWIDYEDSTDRLRYFVGDGSDSESVTWSSPPKNQWVHLVFRYNGTLSLYHNTTRIDGPTQQNPPSTTSDVFIGSSNGNARFMEGEIDDIRIYKEALTDSDVQYLHDKPGAQLNETSTYDSADHTAEHTTQGWTALTLQNAEATVTWRDSGGTTLNTSTFTTSGNKTLTWAEDQGTTVDVEVSFTATAPDAYARLDDEGVQGNVNTPQADDASADPNSTTESVTDLPVTLSVNISDTDFGLSHGDSVTAEFFVDGVSEGTDTRTSDGPVTTTVDLDAGAHTWYVNLTDQYGHSEVKSGVYDVSVPSALEIRDESSEGDLLTGATVTFYARDGFPIDTRTDANNDGSVNMTDLPVGDAFVAVVQVDGFYQRTVYIDDIFDQADIFLYNSNTTSHPVVNNTFHVTDQSGLFPPDDSIIKIQRALNRSLFTDNLDDRAWVTISGDVIGADESHIAHLEEDARYRIVVENADGDQKVLGEYPAQESGTIPLLISQRTFAFSGQEGSYEYGANYTTSGGNKFVTFQLSDDQDHITDVEVVIFEKGNESNEIYNETHAGPFGNFSVSQQVPAGQEDAQWMVDWSATHEQAGEIGATIAVGDTLDPGVQAAGWVKELLSAAAIVITFLFFGRFDVRMGAIMGPSVAGFAWYIGWMPAEVGAGAIFLALMVGGAIFVGMGRQ